MTNMGVSEAVVGKKQAVNTALFWMHCIWRRRVKSRDFVRKTASTNLFVQTVFRATMCFVSYPARS